MTSLPDTGIRLLEPREGRAAVPVQWGVPWPQGTLRELPALDLVTEGGAAPVDSWVTARWPDGSVKWTGHAGLAPTREGQLLPREGASGSADEPARVQIEQAADGGIRVISDRLTLEVGPGAVPIQTLLVEGREVGVAGRLVASSAASADPRGPRREH